MTRYYYKLEEGGEWFMIDVLDKMSLSFHSLNVSHVLIEMLEDGTGIYRKNKRHPFKEDWFRVAPEGMTMIALTARSYEYSIYDN